MPKVSVLMPAYNAEQYIGEAIQSILDQTFEDFEFIIIDDRSTDHTWEIIERYASQDGRIITVRNDYNLNIAANRNKLL
jgi:glycosyltransferase involved in cell wall biosynthesis